MNNLSIFFYDDGRLQVYRAIPINFEIADNTENIRCTTSDYRDTHYIKGEENIQLRAELKTLSKVELDPATMQRIAKYNLEQENESLVEQIKIKQHQLFYLEEELKRQSVKKYNLWETVKRAISAKLRSISEILEHEDNF